MKKTISIILSLVMLVLTFSPMYSALSAGFPYIDENGHYHRLSSGVDTEFVADFDDMIDDFVTAIRNGEKTVCNDNAGKTYNFATTDTAFAYTDDKRTDSDGVEISQKLFSAIYSAIVEKMKISPVDTGDYFENNYSVHSYGINYLTSASDPAFEQDGKVYKYYTFKIIIEFEYNNTVEQETYIREFADTFKEIFLSPQLTDYEKVKTIYDFIVRNTDYDTEVFEGKYSRNSERYKIAHSAYGAIRGNFSEDKRYNWQTKSTITGEKIIELYDQGLAVCEGISNLFYYLCVDNGIPCHIVDGDYDITSGKASDPHEWNYVYLDDGDGARWFQVDITFAENNSFKSIDINSYKYFLGGIEENENFSPTNHQKPYDKFLAICDRSPTNYKIGKADIKSELENDKTIIIRRDYEVDGDKRSTFIRTDTDNFKRIEYEYDPQDKDGNTFKLIDENVNGFVYSGIKADYDIIIPYMVDGEYDFKIVNENNSSDTDFTECGKYNIILNGSQGSVNTYFMIEPLDMSDPNSYIIKIKNKDDNYNNENNENNEIVIGFKGGVVEIDVSIIDQYKNNLLNGRDYKISLLSEKRKEGFEDATAVLDHAGTYYLYIDFIGNYKNSYVSEIVLDKIELSSLKNNFVYQFDYLPEFYRIYNGVNDATSYFAKAGMNLKIGDGVLNGEEGNIDIALGRDYSLVANGNLEYGDKGTITISGLQASPILKKGYPIDIQYQISKKFDISFLDDTGLGNMGFYNGTAYTDFASRIKYLKENVDYKIVDYGDNVNAGESEIVIEGINGCTGRARWKYYINPISIADADIDYSAVDNNVGLSLSYKGRPMVKDVEYTEYREYNAAGYTIYLTGIGNFAGTTTIDVKINDYTSGGNSNQGSGSSQGSSGSSSSSGSGSQSNTGASSKPDKNNGANTNGNSSNTASGEAGSASNATVSVTKPKSTSISKIIAKKKSLVVNWKKNSTANGYQVQIATDSKFKKNQKTYTLNKKTSTSLTVKKLTSKKKYYVRMRAYKTVQGKKYYSSWSKSKSIKVK